MGSNYSQTEESQQLQMPFMKKINQGISPDELIYLQKEFKEKVPYWYKLPWQTPRYIWCDIRMDSKYGFQLFTKFLSQNQSIVFKANRNGHSVINQFQIMFSQLKKQLVVDCSQNENCKKFKNGLQKNENYFEQRLFRALKRHFRNQICKRHETEFVRKCLEEQPLRQLQDRIQERISRDELIDLQKEFKEQVPYWDILPWQSPNNIWWDIRMDSKYGFQLFTKFLSQNQSIVFKADWNGHNAISQFQTMFRQLKKQLVLDCSQNENCKKFKNGLQKNENFFEKILFRALKMQYGNQIHQQNLTEFLRKCLEEQPLRQLQDTIQERISPDELIDLQKEFKEKVPYWDILPWQSPNNIWWDISMDSKYRFQLFTKFLSQNKSIVIKANQKKINIIDEFQKKFNIMKTHFGLNSNQNQNKAKLKGRLQNDPNCFEELLFKVLKISLDKNLSDNEIIGLIDEDSQANYTTAAIGCGLTFSAIYYFQITTICIIIAILIVAIIIIAILLGVFFSSNQKEKSATSINDGIKIRHSSNF